MSQLEYSVALHGAELQSLKFGDREYLWQGDPTYWSRRAPILFPIVGKVAGDTLRVNGQEYVMKQHGFARDSEFAPAPSTAPTPAPSLAPDTAAPELVEGSTVSAAEGPAVSAAEGPTPQTFTMLGDGTRENYPYRYALSVTYRVEGKRLYCAWTVENQDTCEMHFQIGAHPAFNLPDYNPEDPVHGYMVCYDAEGKVVVPMLTHYLVGGLRAPHEAPRPLPVEYQRLKLPSGRTKGLPLILPDLRLLTLSKARLSIRNATFSADAFLLEDSQVARVALLDKEGKKVLTVGCEQAQAFGLWAPAKPGCPFVCLEPWCGITDTVGFTGDISQRELNHRLAPGEKYTFTYWIQVES